MVDQTAFLVSRQEKCLKLIIQMMTGGGAYQAKGKIEVDGLTVTSIPLRNLTHTFSFDIFYDVN